MAGLMDRALTFLLELAPWVAAGIAIATGLNALVQVWSFFELAPLVAVGITISLGLYVLAQFWLYFYDQI
jgi:hypothetical protein